MTTSRMPTRSTAAAAATVRLALPADVTAPAIARAQVRAALAELDVPDQLRDDVLLATSELVTNAFEHGGRPGRLELRTDGCELVIRVFDTSSSIPELKEPIAAAARSRGLQLVRALARRWGYDPAEGGKCVWAAFALS
ncbi:ATP-binding protein [Amycolatopsis benzoatilytica]|uniref:ATP-binding protein n=1 Tax=Amycolatopsis benzoatilytica TaxID=346045 RepID=UPI0003AA463F|nr:ATP-binding protein [Amycolatopsis benzoatilytica]